MMQSLWGRARSFRPEHKGKTYVRVTEAAARLGVCECTIRRLAKAGKIRSLRRINGTGRVAVVVHLQDVVDLERGKSGRG